MEQKQKEVDEKKWVYDSSVDHKGRLPLRASTGVWKASLFIIGKESLLIIWHKYNHYAKSNRIHTRRLAVGKVEEKGHAYVPPFSCPLSSYLNKTEHASNS